MANQKIDKNKLNSKKNTKDNINKSKSKSFATRLIIGILIGIGLMYVVFVFITTNFMGNENYVTEIAMHTSASDTIKSNAFIIRDEEIIPKDTDGTLVFSVNNGDKVVADGTIATIYNSEEDAINSQKLIEINEKIAFLESMNDANTSVNVGVDTVNNQVNEKLVNFIGYINKGNFNNISKVDDDLISLIYRKQIIFGEQGSYKSIINSLNKEKDELLSKSKDPTGEIKSKNAGYFVSSLDGYENIFDVNKLENITYEDFKNIKKNDDNNENNVGKIIKGVNWYIICPISKDDQTTIEHYASEINIQLPYAMNEKIPARIYSTNVSPDDEDHVMLVLSCNYMNSSLAEIRNESIDVLISSFEGIKIPKKALHDDVCTKTITDENGNTKKVEETTQGVYVEFGNELIFKPVYIVYSSNDYVICSENPDSETAFDQESVRLYDKVIVEGSDLYNGKILE